MMKCVTALLLVLPGILCSVSPGEHVSESACSMSKVEQCTHGMVVLGTSIAPKYDMVELDAVCSNWTAVSPCIQEVQDACASSTNHTDMSYDEFMDQKSASQSAQEWTNGYTYLCDTDKSTYERLVYDCLEENRNLTIITEDCFTAYDNLTWWLNVDEPTNSYKFCKAARGLIMCLVDAGSEDCGEDFASWVKSYHGTMWEPHMADIECMIESEFSEGAIAVVSICGGGVVVCIVCILLSCCIKPPVHKNDPVKKSTSTAKLGKDNKAYENGEVEMTNELKQRKNTEKMSREITKI